MDPAEKPPSYEQAMGQPPVTNPQNSYSGPQQYPTQQGFVPIVPPDVGQQPQPHLHYPQQQATYNQFGAGGAYGNMAAPVAGYPQPSTNIQDGITEAHQRRRRTIITMVTIFIIIIIVANVARFVLF